MTTSEVYSEKFYQPEEVQQILQIALARKGEQEELSRSQLWEIAAELEISPDYLEAAEEEWLNKKKVTIKKQEFNLYRREQLRQSVAKYIIVNVFLIIINLLSAGTLSWSWYILLIWGSAISLKTWKTFQEKGESYEQEFEKWYLRQEMKQSLLNFWQWTKKTWQILTSG